MQPQTIALAIFSVLLLGGLGFCGYQLITTTSDLTRTHSELASSTETVQQLEEALATRTKESERYAALLQSEQEQRKSAESEVEDLSDTVDEFEKLSKLDPQLLAKYSKVYFLNENYLPRDLKDIDAQYVFQPDRTYEIHEDVAPFLENLLEDIHGDDIDLRVASAYRSFTTQASLKSSYRVRYGSGANAFSADQGYSEHQLGTTVDFTTPAVGGSFVGFEKSDAYAWLEENAWKYGFILSYPKSNSYYQYEPWHWRFVGKDLARRLHKDNDNFYDLDQRTIDTYLGEIFD